MKKLCLFMTFAVIAIAATAASSYQKVTTTPTDWAGTYLIVCESQNVVFNGGADEENIDAEGGPAVLQDITFTNPLVGSAAIDSATFTIASTGDPEWPWSIQSKSGLYIGHKDSVNNGLSAETELKNKCKQKLTIDATGNLIAIPRYEKCGEYNLQYAHKSSNMRFRYYEPGDKKAIQIYKLISDPSALPQQTDSPIHRFTKVIKDGRMLIIKDGKEYSVFGCHILK